MPSTGPADVRFLVGRIGGGGPVSLASGDASERYYPSVAAIGGFAARLLVAVQATVESGRHQFHRRRSLSTEPVWKRGVAETEGLPILNKVISSERRHEAICGRGGSQSGDVAA